MRKSAAFLLALFLTSVLALPSYSQEIRDIETVVRLSADGSASVVQKWDVTVDDGTEWYIPVDNPGKSYIHDFKVFENGREYANDGRDWDSDRSLEEKTFRCGIVEKRGGDIELCWGQGEYGDHVYTISYIIDNLVQDYGDCDGFHWHFLNDEWSQKPQHASVRIENATGGAPWYWAAEDSCNVRFWGFGMVGDSWLEDGAICFESSEPFSYRSFFSALVRFDKGMFTPKVKGDGTFEALRDEAMKGSDYNQEYSLFDKILAVLLVIAVVALPVLFVGFVLYYIIRRIYMKVTGRHYDKKIFGRNKIDGWWRDIPLDGSPTSVYSLLMSGDMLKPDKNKNFSNVVSAYFLKWIQDGWVAVEKDPRKEDRVNLRFVRAADDVQIDDPIEAKVYSAAIEAAGDNRLLEAGEFKKWSYKNDTRVTGWPEGAVRAGRKTWDKASQEDRCHAVEFRNFLNDFTLTSEREAPEVGLWKQYMVMAASFGIADKVFKNFEKLFPKVMEEYTRQANMMDMPTTYYIIRSLNNSSSSMLSSALDRKAQRAAAAAAAARRVAGGGGSISFGGGGGGFGGGHGGGSR